MTASFQLNTSAETLLNFITDTNLKLAYNSWTEAQGENGHTVFTFSLVAKGTHGAIIAAVRHVEEAGYRARRYWADRYETIYVYLYLQADGEATPRGGVVHSISIAPVVTNNISGLLNKDGSFYSLVIDAEMWEQVPADETYMLDHSDTGEDVTGFGSINVPLAAPDNTAPARIINAWITNTESGHVISDAWVGIRPYYDSYNYFVALWQAEAGALGAGYSLATDANAVPASGANNSVTGAVSDTSGIVTEVYVNDIDGTDSKSVGFVGRFLVLCRCKINANQVELIMKTGLEGSSQFAARDPVLITHTTFRYIPLGELQIVNEADNIAAPTIYEAFWRGFQLWARRTGAASTLVVDCFVLIPSERMVSMTGVSVPNAGRLYWRSPYRELQRKGFTRATTSAVPLAAAYTISNDWVIPEGGGQVICAFNDNATESPTQTGKLQLTFSKRYQVYRTAT